MVDSSYAVDAQLEHDGSVLLVVWQLEKAGSFAYYLLAAVDGTFIESLALVRSILHLQTRLDVLYRCLFAISKKHVEKRDEHTAMKLTVAPAITPAIA